MKTCYYELLLVDRKAEPEDIKKAYRKQALKWHPDKHPNNQEEATRQFRLIKEAYEILSDPQERAFYDRNRESVIRGHGVDFDEGQIVDVMAYFTTSAFDGFHDGVGGFYQVYRDLFAELARQEQVYADPEADISHIPSTTFGSSKASTLTLKEFYAYWTVFGSRMSFAWCDDWELRRAVNRRVRRQMEKENERSRHVAKKEYSENVRELARFVQKRDPRWKQYQEELKAANETRAIVEARKRAEEKARRVNDAVNFQEQDWMKVSDEALEASLEGRTLGDTWAPANEAEEKQEEQSGSDDGEEDEDYDIIEEYYCVACEKAFKSEKQFASHERSKKHIKNLKELEKHMMAEEEYFENSFNASEDELDAEAEIVNEEPESVEQIAETLETTRINSESSDEEEQVRTKRKKKNKKRQQLPSFALSDDEIETGATLQPVAISNDESPTKAQQKQKSKREKKKQQPKETDESKVEEVKCNVCQETFSTRNKLFIHIKDTGHALAPSKPNKKKNSKKG